MEKVAFYILSTNPTPPKIYQRLSNYIDRNSEYIDDSTQHIDLPTNFAKTAPKPPTNPTPAPTPLQRKTPGPPVLFPTLKQMTSHLMPLRNLDHLRYFLCAFFSGEFAACSEFAADGELSGLGTSPSRMIRFFPVFVGSGSGMDESSACVYGCAVLCIGLRCRQFLLCFLST